MKSEKIFSVKELIQDEHFIQWVKTSGAAESDNYWKTYLKENPDQENNVNIAARFIKTVKLDKEYFLPQDELDKIKINIQFRKIQKATHTVKSNNRFIFWSVAAGLLLLLTFYTGYSYWMRQHAVLSASNTPSIIEKRTEYGQKLTISLPDGTLVKMNAGSSISYPAEFSDNQREARFSGEGFFQVKKDSKKPFLIESEGVFTKVLGTSFNLRSYAGEDKINVAVVTGKVKMYQIADSGVLLLPNEMGVFTKTKKQITRHFYNSDEVLAWKEGTLNFNKTELPKVLEELEKWYSVTFVVDENVRLSGDFSGKFQNSNLENVLEGMRFTAINKFQYKIENKKVYLKPE